ncbi:hypothetical protein M408DRAFT_327404 [Serendipita vermifera MAFF 305830]|uniref:Uncharacterized protein n=1 Tax=Serendipita vermifera MAFF 305830 TaxID=933852 RepID=A0A0C3B3U2_SERVB|nr:hypothetical protein M408DRAFT_330267 [Serendipita vermifera MAFF 305830]KIM31114.1 hypothetical protein M408DRAFT_327404 [Serendipita vermifera MAFF 305830]
MCPTFPSQLPLPLLTIRLSTSSILDTVLVDARDNTPIFTIETNNNQTAIHRAAAAVPGGQHSISHVAAIHWPLLHQQKKDAMVLIDGVWMPSSAFLKKSLLGGGSRKFHLPGQSNPLKWKHVGAHWECTLCSHACTAHRAVATYEPAHTTSTARLSLYTQGVRRHDDHKLHEQYDNVDMDMLVYLILTSMLLTTPPHAWQELQGVAHVSEKPLKVHHHHHHHHHNLLHTLAPMMTTSSPSKSPRIDLLGDELPASPIRGSPSSTSSCYSSLPPSPLTPCMDLSPIHHDTFTPATSTNCPITSSVFRRNSNRMPGSPLVSSNSSTCSSNSPTTATPGTPTLPAGPRAITPYHLPPPTPSSSHASHHPSPLARNALHLETSHQNTTVVASPVVPYTTQMYNIQFAAAEEERPRHAPSRAASLQQQQQLPEIEIGPDDLPPAYSEIEWTVRVKQPPSRRNNQQLRLHIAPVV